MIFIFLYFVLSFIIFKSSLYVCALRTDRIRQEACCARENGRPEAARHTLTIFNSFSFVPPDLHGYFSSFIYSARIALSMAMTATPTSPNTAHHMFA